MGRQVKVKKQSLAGRKLLILIYPPLKVCRALLTEGQSAMDGRLSFVEQGRDKFVWNKFKQLGWPEG